MRVCVSQDQRLKEFDCWTVSIGNGTVETLQVQIVWSKRDVGKELEVMPHRV